MSFENLSLHPKILRTLQEIGYSEPTMIQSQGIPLVMAGEDLRASAQTGTGKTAAFLLPALSLLEQSPKKKKRSARVLILAPTRELAMQIAAQSVKYSKHLSSVNTVCLCGGESYFKQKRQLSRPYDVLVATPGRLLDYIQRRKISLAGVETLVLDEADRMLDMGFIQPIRDIIAEVPKSRQTLLFSATLKGTVLKLSEDLLRNPQEIRIEAEKVSSDNVDQKIHFVDDVKHKNRLLYHLLEEEERGHTIIFTSTKRHAEQLTDELKDRDFEVAALHGDMNQRQRTRTIRKLKGGKVKILVATDVASRGIDIQSITHVVNFDLPFCTEDYVHRIGRTGRAGTKGEAISFVTARESVKLKKIEDYIGKKVSVLELPGFEASKKQAKPSPRRRSYKRNGFRKTSNRVKERGGARFGRKKAAR